MNKKESWTIIGDVFLSFLLTTDSETSFRLKRKNFLLLPFMDVSLYELVVTTEPPPQSMPVSPATLLSLAWSCD